MTFGELIYQQPELIRKIENLEKKLANARVAILFNKINKTCLNENILPKFTAPSVKMRVIR